MAGGEFEAECGDIPDPHVRKAAIQMRATWSRLLTVGGEGIIQV